MAKAIKWLQAILDYMKKVKSITSTVHTHPPNGRGGANQRPRKMVITGSGGGTLFKLGGLNHD